MATKKEQRQQEAIEQAAASYREKMQTIKALEKEIAPLKKLLTDHARALGVDSTEIGGITLERRTTKTGVISPERINPDWLYRMQKFGFYGVLKIGISTKEINPENTVLMDYLAEVDYAEKENVTYAVRV